MGQTNQKHANYPQKFSQSFLQEYSEHRLPIDLHSSSKKLKSESACSSLSLQCLETTRSDDESLSSHEESFQEVEVLFDFLDDNETKKTSEVKQQRSPKLRAEAEPSKENYSSTSLPMSERIKLVKSMVKMIAKVIRENEGEVEHKKEKEQKVDVIATSGAVVVRKNSSQKIESLI